MRLIAKFPTIAAFVFRHSRGLPYVFPRNDLDYIGNFVNMTFEIGGRHEPNPVLQRALEILLILHADHEQNCSTNAVRGVGSSHVDPFSAVSAGIAALYGPLHGGANEAVLRMLDEIGDVKNVPAFIEGVKTRQGRLMGFGHRVYKSYDPRAKLIKRSPTRSSSRPGLNPKLEIALELERIALEDDYFVSRKLYPNVDFYSGLIYQAMGYPTDYFTVLFALGRLPGWIAQWEEMLNDPRAEDLAAAADLRRVRRARLRAARPALEGTQRCGMGLCRNMPCESAWPPSIVSVSPVMWAASSESRKSALATTSSSVVKRRSGMSASILLANLGRREQALRRTLAVERPGRDAVDADAERRPLDRAASVTRFQTPALAAAECAVIGLPVQA